MPGQTSSATHSLPSPDGPTLSVRGPWRTAAAFALATLLVVGVALLIGQAASYARVLHALRRANVWWLVLALAGSLLGYVGYALLYQGITRVERGPRPPLPLALRLTVAVFGASVIATAAGRLGGEYWSMRRMHESGSNAWARVLALNTAEWAVLAALAALGAAAALAGATRRIPLALELIWLLVPAVCVPPVLYLTSPSRRSWAEDRGGRVRRTVASVVRSLVLLRLLVGRRRALARTLTGAVLYWGGELLVLWAALRAFGGGLGYAALVVAYATAYVATMLPLPAGGAGGVDAASVFALSLVGVALAPALLATLVQRVFTYWLPLAVAIAGARFVKRLGGELAAVPRPGESG